MKTINIMLGRQEHSLLTRNQLGGLALWCAEERDMCIGFAEWRPFHLGSANATLDKVVGTDATPYCATDAIVSGATVC